MKLSPEKQKNLALTIMVVVGVTYGLWHFMVQGLQKKQKNDTREVSSLKGQITKTDNDIKTEKQNRAQAEAYKVYIAALEDQMPKGNSETWLLKTLSDMAMQKKITISNTAVKPLDEIGNFRFKDHPYKILGFQFEFSADLNQIGKFLEELENKMPLMEVDDLSITAGSEMGVYVHSVAMRISMVVRS